MNGSRRNEDLVEEERGDKALAEGVGEDCFRFLRPLMEELDRKLDVRVVRTLADAVVAIVRHRNRAVGLLLSELGAFIADPKHAPAGTKRIANLIHNDKWESKDIDGYLLREGEALVRQESGLVNEGRALCILDGSVLEKPESVALERLSPVRSAKARRVSRPRPKMGKGYYRGKPGGPLRAGRDGGAGRVAGG